MKQIQPKRIANPSNCGEEIKSTAPKQEYNKSFLLESMMHSSDYIGSESEDDDSYASILLLKIKEPECKIHLDLVGILRMCYQANVKEQEENAEVSNLDNEKQVIILAQLQQFCTKSSIESIITSKGNIDADKIILPFPSVEQQRQLGKLYRSESDGAGENIIKIFKELYPSNSDNGNVGIVILLGDENVSYGDLDLRDI